MSTLWSTWLLVGLAFGTLSVSGVMAENTIDISVLMKQVQSSDCRKRLEAIDLLLKQTSAAAIPALKQEITQQSPRAAEYLKSVFEFVTLGEKAGDEAEAVVRSALEKARKEAGENDETRTTRAVVTLLMAEIKSNRHPYTRAYLVGFLADGPLHLSHAPNTQADPFLSALNSLTSSQDSLLRVAAASTLAMTNHGEKKKLMPILIEGLGSDDLFIRYVAHKGLAEIAKKPICFNPFDPPEQRRMAIEAWKNWWEKKGRAASKQQRME